MKTSSDSKTRLMRKFRFYEKQKVLVLGSICGTIYYLGKLDHVSYAKVIIKLPKHFVLGDAVVHWKRMEIELYRESRRPRQLLRADERPDRELRVPLIYLEHFTNYNRREHLRLESLVDSD